MDIKWRRLSIPPVSCLIICRGGPQGGDQGNPPLSNVKIGFLITVLERMILFFPGKLGKLYCIVKIFGNTIAEYSQNVVKIVNFSIKSVSAVRIQFTRIKTKRNYNKIFRNEEAQNFTVSFFLFL